MVSALPPSTVQGLGTCTTGCSRPAAHGGVRPPTPVWNLQALCQRKTKLCKCSVVRMGGNLRDSKICPLRCRKLSCNHSPCQELSNMRLLAPRDRRLTPCWCRHPPRSRSTYWFFHLSLPSASLLRAVCHLPPLPPADPRERQEGSVHRQPDPKCDRPPLCGLSGRAPLTVPSLEPTSTGNLPHPWQ